jgi:hypothetical protein
MIIFLAVNRLIMVILVDEDIHKYDLMKVDLLMYCIILKY